MYSMFSFIAYALYRLSSCDPILVLCIYVFIDLNIYLIIYLLLLCGRDSGLIYAGKAG